MYYTDRVDAAQRSSLQRVLQSIEGADEALYSALSIGPAYRVPLEQRVYFDRMRAHIGTLNETAAGARRAAERSVGLCAGCQLPLSGDCATVAPNVSYHRHCARCVVCMAPILTSYYLARGNRLHCSSHQPQ